MAELLRKIKKSDREGAPVTLWLIYRYPSLREDPTSGNEILFHRVRRLDIDDNLTGKLREIANRAIDRAKRLEEYSFEGAVEEEAALYETTEDTMFSEVLSLIKSADPAKDVVEKEVQLHRAYAYAIQIHPKGSQSIVAFRKLSRAWKARRLKGLINALLRDKILVSFEDQNVFKFEYRIDFFGTDEGVFVLEKGNFESALNFRVGMERKREELLKSLEKSGLYKNLNILKDLSGTHVRWLKKLANAQKHGKCVDSKWVDALLDCCIRKNWPVKKVNGCLEITKENCERVVRLMNYDLLESPIDQVLFEIDGAKRVVS